MAEPAMCPSCGRALRPCEWCGTADPLPGGEPVITRASWGGGAYHTSCRRAEAEVLAGRLPGQLTFDETEPH